MEQPNVLILMEDCLRYDAYYHPFMADVRRAMWPSQEYANWYSVNNCTDPNVASMLTGLYPWEHGVRFMHSPLGGHRTLFDEYKEKGYTTIFTGWYIKWLPPLADLKWVYFTPPDITSKRDLITGMTKSLMVGANEPWFAFVRHMWCHAKYVNGNYWESVKATAKDVAELVAWVKKYYPNTTIVLTADHGEILPSDKIDAPELPPQHAWGLWEPQVHVPMVVRVPGHTDSLIATRLYQHTDLYSLLTRAVALPRNYVQLEGTGVDKKFARWYHRGIITDRAKLIWGGKRDEEPVPLLYQRNPTGFDETHNLAQAFPKTVVLLGRYLPPSVDYTPGEEQAILKRLEALGYADFC